MFQCITLPGKLVGGGNGGRSGSVGDWVTSSSGRPAHKARVSGCTFERSLGDASYRGGGWVFAGRRVDGDLHGKLDNKKVKGGVRFLNIVSQDAGEKG